VLADAREARAGASARAENEEERRTETNRLSGERFQCPPPLLPERFAFDENDSVSAADEHAAMDRLSSERERIGPVNLVAAEELAIAETAPAIRSASGPNSPRPSPACAARSAA
jgi:chromosome segregation protein